MWDIRIKRSNQIQLIKVLDLHKKSELVTNVTKEKMKMQRNILKFPQLLSVNSWEF